MCMSWTGGNSADDPGGHTPACTVRPVGLPWASTHFGETRRPSMSGTAAARSSCLSPIDAELSIMKRRSILSILFVSIDSVTIRVGAGGECSTGRVRQAEPDAPSANTTPVSTIPCLNALMARFSSWQSGRLGARSFARSAFESASIDQWPSRRFPVCVYRTRTPCPVPLPVPLPVRVPVPESRLRGPRHRYEATRRRSLSLSESRLVHYLAAPVRARARARARARLSARSTGTPASRWTPTAARRP